MGEAVAEMVREGREGGAGKTRRVHRLFSRPFSAISRLLMCITESVHIDMILTQAWT